MASRTYYDPLHKGITLDEKIPEEAMVINLIDSEPFQRLRRIKQLGPASLTFHGAESSRFTHSLGVFHIARIALTRLIKINPELIKYRGLLYASSLLHDIGHGPLSHTSEEMFDLKHEHWSGQIIRNHKEIGLILNNLQSSLSHDTANLIQGNEVECKLIKTLVSSQLDCDRLDYLMRDSHSCGINYGQIDLERILSALTIAPDGDLAINPKGILAVEHYLVVRNLMYRSVYNHRLNEVCNWLLEKIIKTAKKLGPNKIWSDKCLAEWLWNSSNMDLQTFLENDDIRTNYHIMKWEKESPEPLKSLCKNFIHRRLSKAVNIEDFNNEDQLIILSKIRSFSEAHGLDPNLSCGLRHNNFLGYHPYKSGLRIWDGENLNAIEQKSLLIEKLISPSNNAWLIYPKSIHSKVEKLLVGFRKFQRNL
ncbi:HD domain-containing protein [Prochlorococcus marinus]|uniref:HD domain-containing protein n=1 Tax=Prochlorococcus marinus TaxID=1219 RepID=UPI0022B3D237|nr:HD domain-containing protein [Prochlorococcus marinus]